MTRRCRIPLALALAALWLAAAAPAQAAPSTVTRFVPTAAELFAYSGPVLAGDSVAWTRNLPAGDWTVERGSPGSARVRVALSKRPDTTAHQVWLIGGSSTRLAWLDHAYDVVDAKSSTTITRRRQIFASPPTAPVAGCGDRLPECRCPAYCGYFDPLRGDLDGDVLAYLDGDHLDRTIVVDDLASAGEPIRIDRHKLVETVQVAGDHVAWFEGRLGTTDESRTVVWNWREGREVYHVERDYLNALQRDGKIVVDRPGDEGLRWFGPNDPTPHPLDAPPGRYYANVRMANDRLLFTEGLIANGSTTRLLTSDLAGAVETVASGETLPSLGIPHPLDFDGRRAAWTTRDCGLVAVVLDDDVTGDRGDPAPASSCSPPQIADLRVTENGNVAVKLICRRGCRGMLALYAVDSEPRSRLARRRLDLRAGSGARRVLLVPSDADQRRLQGIGKLRVHAIFSGSDGRGRTVGSARAGSLRHP
jgi:hypothetical protein